MYEPDAVECDRRRELWCSHFATSLRSSAPARVLSSTALALSRNVGAGGSAASFGDRVRAGRGAVGPDRTSFLGVSQGLTTHVLQPCLGLAGSWWLRLGGFFRFVGFGAWFLLGAWFRFGVLFAQDRLALSQLK